MCLPPAAHRRYTQIRGVAGSLGDWTAGVLALPAVHPHHGDGCEHSADPVEQERLLEQLQLVCLRFHQFVSVCACDDDVAGCLGLVRRRIAEVFCLAESAGRQGLDGRDARWRAGGYLPVCLLHGCLCCDLRDPSCSCARGLPLDLLGRCCRPGKVADMGGDAWLGPREPFWPSLGDGHQLFFVLYGDSDSRHRDGPRLRRRVEGRLLHSFAQRFSGPTSGCVVCLPPGQRHIGGYPLGPGLHKPLHQMRALST
mmetsp:Transcript_104692/g.265795  ORF Transcript_104692/g.265795 Transcript_104692/m.265795 type:complete len:254 (-) Transcript_104692:79-840(-)